MKSKQIHKFKETKIGLIPEDWEVKELKDVLSEKGYIRGPFGSSLKRSELKTKGIPVYEQEHAIYKTRSFRFFIDNKKFETLSRFSVQENDLIVSCSGTLGKVSLITKDDVMGIISQALLLLRPDLKKINPNFLFYFFDSKQGYDSLTSRSIGSVQVNLAKREIIEKIPIPYPPYPEQQSIARALFHLYSKISLIHQLNETLETILKTIFKSWFIDFDGQTEFEDSELGSIPKGWEVRKVGDVSGINEQTIDKSFLHPNIEYIDISSVSEGKLLETKIIPIENAPSRAKRLVKNHDIIWSTVRPNRKSYLLINKVTPNMVVSTGFAVITPKSVPYSFLYSYLTTEEFVGYLTQNADGSAYPAVNPERISEYKIIVPTLSILEHYDRCVSSILDLIWNNNIQTKNLTKIRDIILPKLMSGEIRI